MTKREARLIVPADIDDSVLAWIQIALSQAFGGFTAFNGWGAWRGQYEEVTIFDIAITEEDYPDLWSLADMLKWRAKQESVYLRGPNGKVEFV